MPRTLGTRTRPQAASDMRMPASYGRRPAVRPVDSQVLTPARTMMLRAISAPRCAVGCPAPRLVTRSSPSARRRRPGADSIGGGRDHDRHPGMTTVWTLGWLCCKERAHTAQARLAHCSSGAPWRAPERGRKGQPRLRRGVGAGTGSQRHEERQAPSNGTCTCRIDAFQTVGASIGTESLMQLRCDAVRRSNL